MKSNRIPIGAALIFTIFTVIMLASFASLALSTANADLAFTQRAEKAMEEYYSLDKQAQARLNELKNGEKADFTVEGEASTLHVSAEMKNNQLEIYEYRSQPNENGEYGGNILDLWDGK